MNNTQTEIAIFVAASIVALIVMYYAVQGYLFRRKIKRTEKALLAQNKGFKNIKVTAFNQVTGIRNDIEKSGLVYWGKIDGHRLYYWPKIDYMFAWRLAAIKLGYEKLGFGISDAGLDAWLESTEESFNNGQMSAVGTSFSFLREYKSQWGQHDILLQIAGCGILVDGEPIDEFSAPHNKIKENLLRNHQSVRAFFLNTSANYLKMFNPESEISQIKDYWMSPQGQRMASTLWKISRMPRFQNLWKLSTANSYGWQAELVKVARNIYFQKPSRSTTKS